MNRIYLGIIFVLCLYIFLHSRWFQWFREVWNEWNSQKTVGKLTMFDVRRLIVKGEKDLAARVYCELFKTNIEEAIKAVDEIDRSIQLRDFEF